MTFKDATDRATTACITLADVAAACAVSLSTVDRARLDPATSQNARPAPEAWEGKLARLAVQRAVALLELAHEIEPRKHAHAARLAHGLTKVLRKLVS